MQVELPLSHYEFEYLVQDALNIPNQSGVIWHSVLGKSLKELSCISKGAECSHCMFAYQCDYTQLLTGFPAVDSSIMRNFNTVPSPLIIQTALSDSGEYKQGDTLKVGFVLCGKANDKLPSLVRALYLAGHQGLGVNRSKLQLKQVTQSTGSGEARSLLSQGKLLESAPIECSRITPTPRRVTLKFITPYIPPGKVSNNSVIDINRLLMGIIRRVDLIKYFSTGVKLDADFKALKTITESIKVITEDVSFHREVRYSSAKGKVKNTSGFVGEVTLDLEQHEELWPYLAIGQSLNVGKNAAMGFGRYILCSLPA